MRPSGHFIGPNLALGAIWVWDPDLAWLEEIERFVYKLSIAYLSNVIVTSFLQNWFWQADP